MKKQAGSKIVKVFSRIINVRTWADWDRVKFYTTYLGEGISRLFVPVKAKEIESFDAAMSRLNISEADLLVKQNALLRLSRLMVAIAVLIFAYCGYHLFQGAFRAAIISFIVMLIALVLSFRYHFWYFQIKKRKLGCTLSEWWRQGLMGERE
jgi:intracellular multiplication protein IcmV